MPLEAILPRRVSDKWGQGHYGASRGVDSEGKPKTHRGVDELCAVGTKILSPIAGTVTKLGYPYGDDLSYRYVEVTTKSGARHRFFYIAPWVHEGQEITTQHCFGESVDLDRRYPGIGNHVHYEVIVDGTHVNPDRMRV